MIPNQDSIPPKLIEVMRADLGKALLWSRRGATNFVAWTFETTRASGSRRRWLLILLAAFLWARSAIAAHPLVISENLTNDLFTYPFEALFAADIFRHILVIATVFWLSLQLAASYMDDVFELGDPSIAEKYILQAAFASVYSTIRISDGRIEKEHLNSPIARIGGPGLVRVNLDSVALFEKADGTPRIIGPTHTPAVLDRFERLRAIIDLRDQVADLNVQGRTKDGIHVSADGVQVVYSVLRGKKEPSLKQPHPFDANAIENIVYRKTVSKSMDSDLEKSYSGTGSYRKSTSTGLNMRPFIQSALKEFIAKSTLSEFLSSVREPEIETRNAQEETLREEAENLAATPDPLIEHKENNRNKSNSKKVLSADGFFSRDQITELFYEDVNKRAKKRGLELHWIDIGTWVLPEESKEIPKQHLEAWDLSVENMSMGSEDNLRHIREKSYETELIRLFQEVPLQTFYDLRVDNPDSDQMIRELAIGYREKLRNTWGLYEDKNITPPRELDTVVRFLNWITIRRLES